MSKSRLEFKVGLFVLIGLVLLGLMLLQFSKGASVFRSTYDLKLRASNVSGLKKRADVLMSGVKVGSVSEIQLSPSGRSVLLTLTIYSNYRIHKDARFAIEQAGFLGDQYVSISPQENVAEIYRDGDETWADPPFNFQEVARSASSLVQRVEETSIELNQTMAEVRSNLLNPNTLTNLALTVSNLRTMSDRAVVTVESLTGLLETNSSAITLTTSNLAGFSMSVNRFGESLNNIVATNEPAIHSAVRNVEASSETLRALMADIEAGNGLAGNLIKNEQLSDSVNLIAHNLSITTSNLNRIGLWGVLRGQRSPPPEPPRGKLSSPKDQNSSR
jgi:phospholipid/cholesterol/gamma-HCH transport system substrate-binding protein